MKKGCSCFLLLANGILLRPDLDKGGLNRDRKEDFLLEMVKNPGSEIIFLRI